MSLIDLRKVHTQDLLAELERRRAEKVKVFTPQARLVFQCETRGGNEAAGVGKFFADRRRYGFIWHSRCTDRPNEKGVGRMKIKEGTLDGEKAGANFATLPYTRSWREYL